MPDRPPLRRGPPPPYPRPRRARRPPAPRRPSSEPRIEAPPSRRDAPDAEPLELEQLQDAWQRSIVDAVRTKSIPIATLLQEARPVALADDTLTLEFAPAAGFHRTQIDDPKNLQLLRDALYEVTGRRLGVATVVAETGEETATADDDPLSEEDVISLLKDTFDAREVEEA